MAKLDNPRGRMEAARDRLDDDQGHLLAFSEAVDPDHPSAGPNKSIRTAETYLANLVRFEERVGRPLDELVTDDVLDELEAMADDLASSTIGTYQAALKAFYRWADGHDVDPEAIGVASGSAPSIDVSSVLSAEEFHALREAADNPRDRCIVDLFGYTGQRLRAVQTLRVRDVDPHDGATGTYRLNDEADGLKGADVAMGTRPLLGAKRSVLDWLSYHPTGEADDALLTTMPSTARGTPGEPLQGETIRKSLRRVAERAGVDKPTNPHALRHFFATAAKRDYGMDDETVRRLLGHAANSRIMETTYRHLSDDDVIRDAEASFGADVEEDQGRLTPPMCPNCYEPVPRGRERCTCGYVFVDDGEPDMTRLRGEVERLSRELAQVDP